MELTTSDDNIWEDKHIQLLIQFGHRGQTHPGTSKGNMKSCRVNQHIILFQIATSDRACNPNDSRTIISLQCNACDSNPRWCKLVRFTLGVCKQQHIISNDAYMVYIWCSGSVANEPAVLVILQNRSRQGVRLNPHDCEISLSVASPFAGKRMLSLASLCSNVAPARITRTHRLTRDAACGWGAQQLVPMMWFIHYFPLAVTEGDPSRSVRDSCIH